MCGSLSRGDKTATAQVSRIARTRSLRDEILQQKRNFPGRRARVRSVVSGLLWEGIESPPVMHRTSKSKPLKEHLR
jgi:hypothetical protein